MLTSTPTNVYESLGITPVINARGNNTVLGGSTPSARVRRAMQDVERYYVDMQQLLERSGQVIAGLLHEMRGGLRDIRFVGQPAAQGGLLALELFAALGDALLLGRRVDQSLHINFTSAGHDPNRIGGDLSFAVVELADRQELDHLAHVMFDEPGRLHIRHN